MMCLAGRRDTNQCIICDIITEFGPLALTGDNGKSNNLLCYGMYWWQFCKIP